MSKANPTLPNKDSRFGNKYGPSTDPPPFLGDVLDPKSAPVVQQQDPPKMYDKNGYELMWGPRDDDDRDPGPRENSQGYVDENGVVHLKNDFSWWLIGGGAAVVVVVIIAIIILRH